MNNDRNFSFFSVRKISSKWRDLLWLGLAWIVTIASMVAGIAPLALVAMYFLAVGAVFVVLMSDVRSIFVGFTSYRFLGLVVLFAVFIGLSSFWSVNFTESLMPAGLIFLFASTFLVPKLLKNPSNFQLHRCARGILAGFLISYCFLLMEYMTDFLLLRTSASYFPDLIKLPVLSSKINNNTAMLVLYMWPALLIWHVWWKHKIKGSALNLLLFCALLPILYQTESDTAKLAYLLALAIFIASHYAPYLAYNLIRTVWAISLIMVVPLMILLGNSGQQANSLLPGSARHRIVIWDYTAKKVLQSPIIGIGIHSDRYGEDFTKILEVRPGLEYSQKGLHPHNMYLQIWYELGAIGAVFVLLMGWMLLSFIHSLKAVLQPYAFATFTAYASMAATGWGLWQPWSLVSLVWAIIFFLIAFEYARRDNEESG